MKKRTLNFIALLAMLVCTLNACVNNSTTEQDPANCTSCDKQSYTGISLEELKNGMINYRDHIWKKTSTINCEDIYNTRDVKCKDNRLDARFMDMDLDDLENYICSVKAQAKADKKKISKIRFYYIQYPGNIKTNDEYTAAMTAGSNDQFSGCHSLALVPVDSTDQEYIKGADGATPRESTAIGLTGSTIDNHNQLCPPFIGCVTNTLIPVVDGH